MRPLNMRTKDLRSARTLLVFLGVLALCACGGGGGGSAPASNVPRFAYVANFSDDTVSIYRVDPATGQLHHRGYVAAGDGPQSVTVDPSGRFAYVANQSSGNVTTFSINQTTGALTEVGTEVLAGGGPISIVILGVLQ